MRTGAGLLFGESRAAAAARARGRAQLPLATWSWLASPVAMRTAMRMGMRMGMQMVSQMVAAAAWLRTIRSCSCRAAVTRWANTPAEVHDDAGRWGCAPGQQPGHAMWQHSNLHVLQLPLHHNLKNPNPNLNPHNMCPCRCAKQGSEDGEVAAERQRVLSGGVGRDTICLRRLHKRYGPPGSKVQSLQEMFLNVILAYLVTRNSAEACLLQRPSCSPLSEQRASSS